MPFTVKRVLTGFDQQGKSIIESADVASNRMELAGWPGAFVTDLWSTDETPVQLVAGEDRGARPIRHDPKPNGSIFRIVEIPPEKELKGSINVDATFESMGSHNKPSDDDAAQHAGMHFTNSIDYLLVLSGEMHMLMEDGEVLLQQNDVIIQRGGKHAWVNRSDKPCVIAAVLIDAIPVANAPADGGH